MGKFLKSLLFGNTAKNIWKVIWLSFAILILPAVGVAYCFW